MMKFIKNNMMPLVFSLLMVVYTLGSSITSGDTEAFRGYAREYDYHYLSFAISRYTSWSSRFLIEAITAYFSVHYIQFFILIFLLSFLLITSLVRLMGFDDEKYQKYNLIVPILAIFFFPINRLFDSAGVIATMTNYYVPMCLLAYSLLVFKKKNNRYGYIFKLLAFIFAMQQEQFALLSFIIFFMAIIYQISQKTPIKKYIPFLILSTLGILSVKLSPGNTKRTIIEIREHFPEFANLSLLRKLDIGFIRMNYDLLFDGEVTLFLILMLVGILSLAVLRKKFNQSIGLMAILIMIVLPYLHIWTPISKMKSVYDSFPKGLHGDILSITGNTFVSVYPDLAMILMLIVIAVIIWTVLTSYRDRVIVFTLLIGGTATKMVLALSPTVSISGIRTFVPMIFCGFIFTIYFIKLILNEIIEDSKEVDIIG